MLFSFTFVHKIYIFWLSPLELLASTLNKTKSRLVTNRKLKQEHENAMSPKTDERKFIPLHQVIKVFVSRSRGEISGWRGSRRSLGGLVFPRVCFTSLERSVVEPWQNMTAKNHSLNLFYHVEIAIASCNCDVEIPRFLRISLISIWSEIFHSKNLFILLLLLLLN